MTITPHVYRYLQGAPREPQWLRRGFFVRALWFTASHPVDDRFDVTHSFHFTVGDLRKRWNGSFVNFLTHEVMTSAQSEAQRTGRLSVFAPAYTRLRSLFGTATRPDEWWREVTVMTIAYHNRVLPTVQHPPINRLELNSLCRAVQKNAPASSLLDWIREASPLVNEMIERPPLPDRIR